MNSKRRCSRCHDFKLVGDLVITGIQARCRGGCTPQRATPASAKQRPKPRPKVKATTAAPGIPLEVRAQVLSRDLHQCVHCGAERALHVHHVDYGGVGRARTHEPSGLVTLCRTHHELVHSDKRRWQPLLRGYIWLLYTTGAHWAIPQLEEALAA